MAGENGWNEWSRHVLAELKRLSEGDEALKCKLSSIEVEVAKLNVKAGLWGALGGAIPVGIGLLISLLKG